MIKQSFPPLADERTRLLILGSLPGEASLKQGQYYAHPRNNFWQLVGTVIGRDLVSMAYEERLKALQEVGIGLWDSVRSARREGSLDSAIRDVRRNPLAELCASLPALRAIAFNGVKSATVGRAALRGHRYTTITLPSSSPAHASMALADKQELWLGLRRFLR